MDATNPYEPPRSEPSVGPEQKFASRLLSVRDRPVTLGTLYRMGIRTHIIISVYFGPAIAYFAWADLQPGFYLMLGVLCGVLVTNFAMARAQTKLWPMQEKVLDWEKVRRMALGEPVEE